MAGPSDDVVLDFLRSPLGFLDRVVQQYGGSVGLRLGGERVVLLTNPALSRQVLIDLAATFGKVILIKFAHHTFITALIA